MKNKNKKDMHLDVNDIHKYFLLEHDHYSFYAIDIGAEKLSPNHPIVKRCEIIEKTCWASKENFYNYLSKRDLLLLVSFNEEIIGFALASAWMDGVYGIFAGDEVMIIPEYRGKKLTIKLTWLGLYLLTRFYSLTKEIKQLVGFGLSCNPRTMMMIYKRRKLLLESNFSPRSTLSDIAKDYINHLGYKTLTDDDPFFVKGIYPGSHKMLQPINNEYIVTKECPPEFDYKKRGDCMLLAGRHKINVARLIMKLSIPFIFKRINLDFNNPGWQIWQPENRPLINPAIYASNDK